MSLTSPPTALLVIAYVVLILAPWPVLRLLSVPSFRREYNCLAIRAVMLIAAYVLFLAAITYFYPELIFPIAAVAAIGLLAERWRARPGYGRGSNLPPGSLSLAPRGPWVDERFYRKQAEKFGPVFKMSLYFRPMVCVLGPREGLRLFREASDKLMTPPMRYNKYIPNGFLRYMEPKVHEKYRVIFRRAFSKEVLDRCRTDFAAILAVGLSEMAELSRERPGAGIHPAPHVEHIVFKLVVRLFIGVDESSDTYRQLKALYEEVVVGKISCKPVKNEEQTNVAIAEIIGRQIEKAPGNLPDCFLAAIIRQDVDVARDRTVVMNLVYMIKIVTADLSGLLIWVIKLLTDNPQWLEKMFVAAETSASDGERTATLILKETLRLERSEFIYRKAAADVVYNGFTIPKGWFVRVCIRDGHRDPAVFPDPDAFNPERFLERSFTREEYSPLGLGTHSCLGEQVVYALGPAFLIELTRSFAMHKRLDGPREYGHAHWEPSAKFRVELLDREAG